MGKADIVKVEPIMQEMVKATCPYCYEALPQETKAAVVEAPYKIQSFNDLCEGHQKEFLDQFTAEDRQIAIDMVNAFGEFMNPSARAFLPNVGILVEGKKQRDKEYEKTRKSLKQYMKEMKTRVDERIAKEEVAKVEMAIRRGKMDDGMEAPSKTNDSIVTKRTRKSPKAESPRPKKLSEIADAVQAQMAREGLSPSEIMNRVSSGPTESSNVVAVKKKRGRPPGKSKRG